MRFLKTMILTAFTLALAATANAQSLLTKGVHGPPVSADPVYSSNWNEVHLLVDVFEGLTTYDRNGDIVYGQAISHEVSEDGLEYTFTLRDDIVWSDGHPVHAEDFAFAVRRLFDESLDNSGRASYAAGIIEYAKAISSGERPLSDLGVEALDDRRVKFRLEQPAPYFFSLLAQSPFYPVPKHKVEELGEEWAEPGVIVSNGAYLFISAKEDGIYHLSKNPLYRDEKNVAFDNLRNVVLERTGNDAERRFQAKEIDVIVNEFPVASEEWLQHIAEAQMITTPTTLTHYLIYNHANEKLADPRIKWALSLSIDRELIVEHVRPSPISNRAPAFTVATPSLGLEWRPQKPEWAEWPRERRIETARAYLAELGYSAENPLTITLHLRSANNTPTTLFNALQAMFQEVHVDLVMRPYTGSVFRELMKFESSDEFMMIKSGYNAIYDHPSAFYGYLNSTVENIDRLLKERGDEPIGTRYVELHNALTQVDDDELLTHIDLIEREIWEIGPVIPLFHAGNTHMIAPHVDFGAPNFNKLVYARHIRPT